MYNEDESVKRPLSDRSFLYFAKRIKELDAVFDEFARKIESPADQSIKIFPKNTDKKEQDVLIGLSREYLIEKDLSPQNKYNLSMQIFCKTVVKELLKYGFNQNSGFIFMKRFIDYSVADATIQNYFRECKKDLPLLK